MFRLQHTLALIGLVLSFNLAHADDKPITIDIIRTKVQALSLSTSKTIDALKKSNQATGDLKGQMKQLDEAIVLFEKEVQALEKGGTIYQLTLDAQSGSRKLIETMEADLSSGTNNATQVKDIENLIKSQRKVLSRFGNLIIEMSEKADRIKSKLKDLKGNKKIIVYKITANQQEAALKQLKECMKIFDDIESDIDTLNDSTQKMASPE